MSVCYDSHSRTIWSYCQTACLVKNWVDLGPSSEPYAPDRVLSSPEFQLTGEYAQPYQVIDTRDVHRTASKLSSDAYFQAAMFILSHMDRLSRQHPAYHHVIIGDGCLPPPPQFLPQYCAEASGAVITRLNSLLRLLLESVAAALVPAEGAAYMILACLRLLRVNAFEISNSTSSRKDLGLEGLGLSISQFLSASALFFFFS